MSDGTPGFVSLKSLRHGAPDPEQALADIRRIYFATSKKTIDHDFAHAVELLKSLPSEDARQKAHVYMEGLAEMARQWARPSGTSGTSGKSGTSETSKTVSGRSRTGKQDTHRS